MTAEQPKKVEPTRNRGGRWVVVGSELYLVPALSLGSVVAMQNEVDSLKAIATSGRPTAEQMDIVVRLVHAAIKRNYPDMAIEEVGDMIDLDNYSDLLSAVLSISGFKREGSSPAGEAGASTGT